MAKVILGNSMSLDGYINDPSGSVMALYPDMQTMRYNEVMQESIRDTGAVVMGRHSYDMAEDPDVLADNYEYQVPIFVLTHHPPARQPRENGRISFTFVSEGIESALAQAKQAAGEKDVTIIGAPNTSMQVLEAGLADELHIDFMPVVLGGGLRFFHGKGLEALRLERTRVVELPGGRTHLEFRIIHD
jgi:dihydrofolate reductase